MTHKYFIVEKIVVENLTEENFIAKLSFFTNGKFFMLNAFKPFVPFSRGNFCLISPI